MNENQGVWIRFWADHGAGHQSHSETYVWFAEEPDQQTKKDYWECWVDRKYINDAIGDYEIVQTLPAHVLQSKIEYYEFELAHAQRMLEILNNMKNLTSQ